MPCPTPHTSRLLTITIIIIIGLSRIDEQGERHAMNRTQIGLEWSGVECSGLGYILDWIGLEWSGVDWIGLDWIGLEDETGIGVDWIGSEA